MSEQPQGAPPQLVQPVPLNFAIGEASMGGQVFVVLQINSPVGTAVYLIPPEIATQIGPQITEQGKKSSGPKLVVPQPRMPGLQDILGKVNGHGG